MADSAAGRAARIDAEVTGGIVKGETSVSEGSRMEIEPRGCPFCLARAVRRLASFEDTLTAYRCPECRGVFYTITPRFDAEPMTETDLADPHTHPRDVQ